MKEVSLILTFILLCAFCKAQDTIGLSFDPVKKDFKDNTKSIDFRSGVSYRILISGLNTAVIDYKITSKSYTMTSSIPEILKPVFPGISEEFAFDFLKPEQGKRDIQTVASYAKKILGQSKTRYSQLCQLKEISDALYKSTKIQINRGQAGVELKNAEDIFRVKSPDALRRQVLLNSKYIMATQEILKKIME